MGSALSKNFSRGGIQIYTKEIGNFLRKGVIRHRAHRLPKGRNVVEARGGEACDGR
jgi:hypothetical protein